MIFLQRRSQAKRTTIILDDKEREYIDSLIKEGKEPGIKHLVSKMLDIYRTMMIHDWKYPGEYYCGISRVAFVNVEFINILLKQIPKEKWLETGKEIGEAAKISLEAFFLGGSDTTAYIIKVFITSGEDMEPLTLNKEGYLTRTTSRK